jgi:hypothetical protein
MTSQHSIYRSQNYSPFTFIILYEKEAWYCEWNEALEKTKDAPMMSRNE